MVNPGAEIPSAKAHMGSSLSLGSCHQQPKTTSGQSRSVLGTPRLPRTLGSGLSLLGLIIRKHPSYPNNSCRSYFLSIWP